MRLELSYRKNKYRKGGFHSNPNISWEIMLLMTALVCAVFVAFSFSLFMEINGELEEGGSGEVSINPALSAEKINNLLFYFQARAEKSGQITGSSARFVDPSR